MALATPDADVDPCLVHFCWLWQQMSALLACFDRQSSSLSPLSLVLLVANVCRLFVALNSRFYNVITAWRLKTTAAAASGPTRQKPDSESLQQMHGICLILSDQDSYPITIRRLFRTLVWGILGRDAVSGMGVWLRRGPETQPKAEILWENANNRITVE